MVVEKLTKSTSDYMKCVLVLSNKNKNKREKINFNKMSLKQTIEKLEDEDDRDELSSDHSEQMQK